MVRFFLFLFSFFVSLQLNARVDLGVDRVFEAQYRPLIEGKRIGLITNQTGVTSTLESSVRFFEKKAAMGVLTLQAIFAPEHGLYGEVFANQKVASSKTESGVPIYSLYGETRRPTREMLNNIDVLVYDIQDIGSRPYTYVTTLFYVMEEAARKSIPVVVLDRPNPLGGKLVDGPMVEEKFHSFVGYIDIPYCHGMTVGELARFFQGEKCPSCKLVVVPMRGWTRNMRFEDTKLSWIPASPNIPEATTPLFFPATGLLGELNFVCIGIGSTLPFKVVVAPWIKAKEFAAALNKMGPEGVFFKEFHFIPSAGQYHGKKCEGVLLVLRDGNKFNPIKVQFWIFDVLKRMYPERVRTALSLFSADTSIFYLVCGSKKITEILTKEKSPFSALLALHSKERAAFFVKRQKYLIMSYNDQGLALK